MTLPNACHLATDRGVDPWSPGAA